MLSHHGIVFHRIDVSDSNNVIPATVHYAMPYQLYTRMEIVMVWREYDEHMAAFHGLGIDNLLIEVDGPEMPILDGSSSMIIGLLTQAGLQEQTEARQVLVIVDDVEIDLGNGKHARLSPHDQLELDVCIDFEDRLIGQQSLSYSHDRDAFQTELADARLLKILKPCGGAVLPEVGRSIMLLLFMMARF